MLVKKGLNAAAKVKQVLIHSEEISEAKQQELNDAGFVTLRVADVNSFRVMTPVPPILSGDALVTAAFKTINNVSGNNRLYDFGWYVNEAIKQR